MSVIEARPSASCSRTKGRLLEALVVRSGAITATPKYLTTAAATVLDVLGCCAEYSYQGGECWLLRCVRFGSFSTRMFGANHKYVMRK